MNNEIMRRLGFGAEVDRVEKGLCPSCGKKIDGTVFNDRLSVKEYMISGLCQSCQDNTFRG